MSLELDLENEIRVELEKLESIFNEESYLESMDVSDVCGERGRQGRVSYSAYEYAEAEGEKEKLEDKLNQLMSKTEECNAQMEYITQVNSDLQARNALLVAENERLKEKLGHSKSDVLIEEVPEEVMRDGVNFSQMEFPVSACHSSISQGSIALEILLAETRAQLNRAEAAYRDAMLMKNVALEELEKEKGLRLHVEKERDAFSAAYEASLQHFEKWNRITKSTN